MKIRCAVACQGGNGPLFYFCTVKCTQDEYKNGDHYDRAEMAAVDDGWDGPAVVFDENDGPDWLFAQFPK